MVAFDLKASSEKIEELLEKYVGKKQKMKAQKNPYAPKKPKSSYFFFCDVYRPKFIEKFKLKNPGKPVQIKNIAKELGCLWKQTTDKAKETYIKSAKDDKARYENEINEFNEKFG
jgi:structure-specific recognition protein 1